MTKPKIKAILFDMDGVLIDAKDWHYDSLNKALKLFGFEISRYDHLVTYDGLPTLSKLNMLTLERGLPSELHLFINEIKQQYMLDEINVRCKPFFAHEYALAKLKSKGFKLAVCSNSIRKTVELMLEKAKIIDYFDFLISNQDVKKCKPDPEMYLSCMSWLNVKPEETLILEDSEHGVRAALESGAHLMRIENTSDVNYLDIMKLIGHIQEETK